MVAPLQMCFTLQDYASAGFIPALKETEVKIKSGSSLVKRE